MSKQRVVAGRGRAISASEAAARQVAIAGSILFSERATDTVAATATSAQRIVAGRGRAVSIAAIAGRQVMLVAGLYNDEGDASPTPSRLRKQRLVFTY